MARVLSAATGREVSFVNLSLADFRASLLDMGRPEYFADGLSTLYGQLRDGAQSHVTNTVEEVTGRAARSFADFVGDHVDAFTGG